MHDDLTEEMRFIFSFVALLVVLSPASASDVIDAEIEDLLELFPYYELWLSEPLYNDIQAHVADAPVWIPAGEVLDLTGKYYSSWPYPDTNNTCTKNSAWTDAKTARCYPKGYFRELHDEMQKYLGIRVPGVTYHTLSDVVYHAIRRAIGAAKHYLAIKCFEDRPCWFEIDESEKLGDGQFHRLNGLEFIELDRVCVQSQPFVDSRTLRCSYYVQNITDSSAPRCADSYDFGEQAWICVPVGCPRYAVRLRYSTCVADQFKWLRLPPECQLKPIHSGRPVRTITRAGQIYRFHVSPFEGYTLVTFKREWSRGREITRLI